MAWDSTQREKINEKRGQGVVTVRMHQVGCDVTAQVVDCVGKTGGAGTHPYEFTWYYRSETMLVDTQREAFAKLPLGAASLGADIGAGRSLRVDFVMVGSYVLPEGVSPKEWVGRECGKATHYVKRVVVGGFASATGEREAVHADVGLFGVGAGAGQQTTRLSWKKEGSPDACREAEKKQGESPGCNMPLRLELEPKEPSEPSVATPLPTPVPPPATTTATPPPAPTPERTHAPPPRPAPTPTPERTHAPPPAPTPTPQRTYTPPPAPPVQPLPPVGSSGCPSGMAGIEGGAFMMGSDSGDSDEKPVHRAELDGFCMDVTEVTVDAFAQCVRAGSCSTPDTSARCNWGVSGRGKHPINCVDWNQANGYCRWASKTLPTEAQWEYAARGGSQGLLYPWGGDAPGRRACWDGEGSDLGKGNRQSTCEVGTYPAGAFGLRDMAGNVYEWVQDWYGDYPSSVSKNHAGPSSGTDRVRRGGSWFNNDPSLLRAAYRSILAPGRRNDSLGFRCVRPR